LLTLDCYACTAYTFCWMLKFALLMEPGNDSTERCQMHQYFISGKPSA
jgi:hypothetical protein